MISGLQGELADVYLSLFGKYVEVECQVGGLTKTPRSELRVVVPSNHQSSSVAENMGSSPAKRGLAAMGGSGDQTGRSKA